jgi:hypothetical protein
MIRPQLNVQHEMGYMCHHEACYICNLPWQRISWKYYLELLRKGYWKRIRIKWSGGNS